MSPDTDPGSRDSAGVPWEGRSFEPNPHAGDDGSADPALLAALTAPRDGAQRQVAVVDALPLGAAADPARRREGRRGRRRARPRRRQDPGAVDRHGRRAGRPPRAAGVHVGRGDAAMGCRSTAGSGRRRPHGSRGLRRRHRSHRDRPGVGHRVRHPSSRGVGDRAGSRLGAEPDIARGVRGAAGERRGRARRARSGRRGGGSVGATARTRARRATRADPGPRSDGAGRASSAGSPSAGPPTTASRCSSTRSP